MTATLYLAAVSAVRFSSSGDKHSSSARFRGRNPLRAVTSTAPAASLYEVLRVEQDASPMEIKSAFRSLAKLYHPDIAVRRSPDSDDCAAGDFLEIRSAYETLSDPSARAMYDLVLIGRGRRLTAPLSMSRSSGFYSTRSWETDQCW